MSPPLRRQNGSPAEHSPTGQNPVGNIYCFSGEHSPPTETPEIALQSRQLVKAALKNGGEEGIRTLGPLRDH